MTIDFEKDQEQVLDKTTNINKLADKIKELQAQQEQLQIQEDAVKQKKKDIEYLSGEVIPTMLSEMGLSLLKQITAPQLHKLKKLRRLTGFVRMAWAI